MSTKTSIKRIALVAVAGLGFGMVSTVSANATGEELAAGGSVTAITASSVTTSPITGSAVYVKFGASLAALTAAGGNNADIITFKAALTSVPTGGSVGVTSVVAGDASPAGTATAVTVSAGTAPTLTASASLPQFTVVLAGEDTTAWSAQTKSYLGAFKFTPTKTGSYTMTIWNDADRDGSIDQTEVYQTASITVGSPSGWSQALSTVYVAGATADTLPTSSTYAVPVVKTLGTKAGVILVTLKNTDAAAYAGQTVSATVSGVGFVGGASTAAAAPSGAEVDTADGSATTTRTVSISDSVGTVAIGVWGDGIAGTSTVTVSVTDQISGATTVVATKSFTFYGTKSAISLAESNLKVGRAGGYNTGYYATMGTRDAATKIPAAVVKVADASGYAVAGSTVTATSSDSNVVASATCAEDNNNADYGSGGTGFFNCYFTTTTAAKSGDKATITFKTLSSDGVTYLTVDYPVTVGGSVATETITLDKSEYTPGESIIVTRTAKDASGNPVYDGAAAPAISANKSVGGSLPGASTYVAGVKTTSANTLYAPAVEGSFTLSATSGNTAGDTISVTAKVIAEGSSASDAVDAANEATDAANAATDAANAAAEAADAATAAAQDAQAAVAALATSVASLIAGIKAQITTLTNLVIKIQKKVKA